MQSFSAWKETMFQRLQAMNANRAQDALIIAHDLNAAVQLRVQTSGRDYRGAKFSPYSEGYKKVRRKAGAQTNYVDFTRTGQLWRNVRPEVVSQTATETVVDITARDALNQSKLRGAVTQPKGGPRGNILIPSDREIAQAAEANRVRIRKYFPNA